MIGILGPNHSGMPDWKNTDEMRRFSTFKALLVIALAAANCAAPRVTAPSASLS
jgi:hypothetical protein